LKNPLGLSSYYALSNYYFFLLKPNKPQAPARILAAPAVQNPINLAALCPNLNQNPPLRFLQYILIINPH
jgi:hypothetical protein